MGNWETTLKTALLSIFAIINALRYNWEARIIHYHNVLRNPLRPARMRSKVKVWLAYEALPNTANVVIKIRPLVI